MQRTLKVVFVSEEIAQRKVSGIYMMWSGWNIYVGSSVDIKKRAMRYKVELEKMFREYGDKPNKLRPSHYLKRVFDFYIKNPKHDSLCFGVLQECIDPDKMLEIEKKWTTYISDDGYFPVTNLKVN